MIALAFVVARPSFAFAAPSTAPTSSVIERKQAEEAQVRAEMDQARIDLAMLVDRYLELSKGIDRAKIEVADVTEDLARMQLELENAEQALRDRAVELYRGDRDTMLNLIFSSSSLQELWVRSSYLAKINLRDARLVNGVRLARQENLWLQQGLYERIERLNALQADADAQRERIEADLETQEKRAAQLRVDLARLMWSPGTGSAPRGGFNPDAVISEAQFRDANAMTLDQIQAFLEDQPGSLATYRARDHTGKAASTAEMIFEAAQAWGVNPKVILCVLQKEQSLLGRPRPAQRAYDWAMGCGKTDSRTFTKYKGFGKQIWHGAERLAVNGRPWRQGITMRINGSTIQPANAATYSLFKYTPHFRGTMSFWMLYWRYFGDPSS